MMSHQLAAANNDNGAPFPPLTMDDAIKDDHNASSSDDDDDDGFLEITDSKKIAKNFRYPPGCSVLLGYYLDDNKVVTRVVEATVCKVGIDLEARQEKRENLYHIQVPGETKARQNITEPQLIFAVKTPVWFITPTTNDQQQQQPVFVEGVIVGSQQVPLSLQQFLPARVVYSVQAMTGEYRLYHGVYEQAIFYRSPVFTRHAILPAWKARVKLAAKQHAKKKLQDDSVKQQEEEEAPSMAALVEQDVIRPHVVAAPEKPHNNNVGGNSCPRRVSAVYEPPESVPVPVVAVKQEEQPSTSSPPKDIPADSVSTGTTTRPKFRPHLQGTLTREVSTTQQDDETAMEMATTEDLPDNAVMPDSVSSYREDNTAMATPDSVTSHYGGNTGTMATPAKETSQREVSFDTPNNNDNVDALALGSSSSDVVANEQRARASNETSEEERPSVSPAESMETVSSATDDDDASVSLPRRGSATKKKKKKLSKKKKRPSIADDDDSDDEEDVAPLVTPAAASSPLKKRGMKLANKKRPSTFDKDSSDEDATSEDEVEPPASSKRANKGSSKKRPSVWDDNEEDEWQDTSNDGLSAASESFATPKRKPIKKRKAVPGGTDDVGSMTSSTSTEQGSTKSSGVPAKEGRIPRKTSMEGKIPRKRNSEVTRSSSLVDVAEMDGRVADSGTLGLPGSSSVAKPSLLLGMTAASTGTMFSAGNYPSQGGQGARPSSSDSFEKVYNPDRGLFTCIDVGVYHDFNVALNTLREIRFAQGISLESDGGVGDVVYRRCLYWHLRGKCRADCLRLSDHQPLGPELTRQLEQALLPVIGPNGPIVAKSVPQDGVWHSPQFEGGQHKHYDCPDAKRQKLSPGQPTPPVSPNQQRLPSPQNEQADASDKMTIKFRLPYYFGNMFLFPSIMGEDGIVGEEMCRMCSCSIRFDGKYANTTSEEYRDECLVVLISGTDLEKLFLCQQMIEQILCRKVPPALRGCLLANLGGLNDYRAKFPFDRDLLIIQTLNPLSDGRDPDDLRYVAILKPNKKLPKSLRILNNADSYKRQLEEHYPSCHIEAVQRHQNFPYILPHIVMSSENYDDVVACLKCWREWADRDAV